MLNNDMYTIYQLKQTEETLPYRFEPMERLKTAELKLNPANYEPVYSDYIGGSSFGAQKPPQLLESIYRLFNTNHPADFMGHSLSVSDIIVLRRDDEVSAHYVDRVGYRNLPGFEKAMDVPEYPAQYDPAVQPIVTILWSESDRLLDNQRIPLHIADRLFKDLDDNQRIDREKPDHKGAWYYKAKFRIDFVQNGEPDTYEGRQDFGDGDGSLIDHIRAHAKYYRNDEGWQKEFAKKGAEELAEINATYDYVLQDFVPYLELHCQLAQARSKAVAILNGLKKADPVTQSVIRGAAYNRAVIAYVDNCRRKLNHDPNPLPLPEQPGVEDIKPYFKTPDAKAYEGKVMAEIRQEARDAAMTLDEYAANGYEPKPKVEIKSAVISNYKDMVALVGQDDKVYLGKRENYHFISSVVMPWYGPEQEYGNEASYYDNRDGSLRHISDNREMYGFLYGEGWVKSQEKMLENGFTVEHYKEFARLQNGPLRQYETVQELSFDGQPFQPPENWLANAEMGEEQGYSFIDGIINNTEPEPPMPGTDERPSLAEKLKEAKRTASEQQAETPCEKKAHEMERE